MSIVVFAKWFQESIPLTVDEMGQSTSDPKEGIDTNPLPNEKPRVLQTHDQHAADYVRLMLEEGMNLSMGEDRATPLITKVKPLIFFFHLPAFCH